MADKSEEYILAIEIAETSLRIMQRHLPTNTVDLVHIEPMVLSEAAKDDNLALLLRQVVRLYRKLFKTRYAVFSLPYHRAYLRLLHLDSDSNDIKEQIEWEFEQEAVGKTGKYVFDWIDLSDPQSEGSGSVETKSVSSDKDGLEDVVLDKEMEAEMAAEESSSTGSGQEKSGIMSAVASGSGGRKFLMAAVEEEQLSWMEGALKKLKIVPLVCDIDVLALVNIFSHNYPNELGGLSVLAYINGGRVLIVLTQQGQYLDSDQIELGPLTDEGLLKDAVKKIESKIVEFPAAASGTVQHCYVCGDSIADNRLRETLLASFTLPVEVLEPFRALSISPEIKNQVQMVAPALAIVAGLTLRAPAAEEARA